MDLAPPQAPPAIARDATENATALVQRIADTGRWLIDQQAFLPATPVDAQPSDRTAFMEELEAYWRAPAAPHGDHRPVPRSQAFALRLAALMADQAALGVADGSLDEQARDAIHAFTAAQGHLLPPHIGVRELVIGALPYAGSVVIVDERDGGSAMLFAADRGWERFHDLDALHAEVEERFREALAAGLPLPGLADDDAPILSGDVAVTSRDIDGNGLDAVVGSVVDVQRRKVIDAWTQRDEREGSPLRLADRLHDALAFGHYLDVTAMLYRRQAHLLSSAQESRLSQLPVGIREAWEHALATYRKERAKAVGILAGNGFDRVVPIDRFARDELAIRLRSRGIADDPADIAIELFATTTNTMYGYSGTDVERRSLIDLARENVGFAEWRGMQARTASGGFLLSLRRDDIVDMIRELDLRNRYQDYLVHEFKTSVQGQRLRAASARLQEARMRFELADARSTTYIAGDSKDFIDDHAERGYRWVEAVLDAPTSAGRRRVDNHDIVVSHLVYEGARLKDVLAIGVRSQAGVNRTVFYTPDAPDGRSFREFADRQEAASAFLHHPAFEQYLTERLPMARSLTEGRFADEEIAGDFFESVYDTALGQLGIDAADLARSTGEADYDQARSIGMLSVRFAEGFLPVRLGVAVASVRALHSIWQGVGNVSRGERTQAFADFVDAFSSVGDLPAAALLTRSFGRTILSRVGGRAHRLASAHARLPELDAAFDARYLASGVKSKDARSVKDGILEIGSGRYIEHDGKLYGVHFDRDNATWRLRKPGHAATDYAPPVVRDGMGRWRHNKNVGLRGGTGGRPDLHDKEPAGLLIEHRGLNPETAGLSDNDVEVLVGALARQGLRPGVMKRLIYDRTHERPTSAVLARHWDSALDEARRPPPRIRVPTPPAATGFDLVKLERSQWPATVWHYTTPYRHAMFRGSTLTLSQSLPSGTGPSGLHVMTLDPGRPSRQIVGIMRGRNRVNTFTDDRVRTIAGAYVEIDLRKLRDRQRPDGTFEFNVYTVTNRSAQEFVIKPTLPAPQHGLAPLSPTGQRDLPGIPLQSGEFRTGLRFP